MNPLNNLNETIDLYITQLGLEGRIEVAEIQQEGGKKICYLKVNYAGLKLLKGENLN